MFALSVVSINQRNTVKRCIALILLRLSGIKVRETAMSEAVHLILSSIRTVDDIVAAFTDEERFRRILEATI